jgi:hypothetical protein
MLGLLKGVVEIVKLPVDVVADVITMGGAMTEQNEPYTSKRCKRIMKKLNED